MSAWRINGSDPELLGISGLKLTFVNQAPDRLIFTQAMARMDDNAFLAWNQSVTLSQNGVPWFRGRANEPRRTGSAGGEKISYEVLGLWWELDRLPLEQVWQLGFVTNHEEAATRALRKGRFIAMLDDEGDPQSVGATIAAILEYAKDCGVDLSIGTIDIPLMVAPQELISMSAGEAIRALLRWQPDAVASINYQGVTPQINIRRASQLSSVVVQYGDAANAFDIQAARDRQVSEVVLRYEVARTIGQSQRSDLVVDAYPPSADGGNVGALVQTIPWQGSDMQFLKQKIVVREIRDNVSTATKLKQAREYWAKLESSLSLRAADRVEGEKIPELTFHDLKEHPKFAEENAGVKFKRALREPAGEDEEGEYEFYDPGDPENYDSNGNPKNARKVRLQTNLVQELIEGEIQHWMRGVKGQPQTVTAYISWTENGAPKGPELCVAHVMATNAQNREYAKIASYEEGEPIPVGVAEAIFNALNRLEWRGEVVRVQAECTGWARVGMVLNISGGRGEWANMDAIIQSVEEDLDAGLTRVTIGPAEQLAPQDFIELLRMNRRPEGNTGAGGANDEIRRTGKL
jgi:hypothetical protein